MASFDSAHWRGEAHAAPRAYCQRRCPRRDPPTLPPHASELSPLNQYSSEPSATGIVPQVTRTPYWICQTFTVIYCARIRLKMKVREVSGDVRQSESDPCARSGLVPLDRAVVRQMRSVNSVSERK